MRNAARLLILGAGVLLFGACHKSQPQATANQDLSIDDNAVAGQLPQNADIETLPPDESSETSSNELSTGDDNPDVNDVGNRH